MLLLGEAKFMVAAFKQNYNNNFNSYEQMATDLLWIVWVFIFVGFCVATYKAFFSDCNVMGLKSRFEKIIIWAILWPYLLLCK